ncbi:MAG: FAD-dependent oxidoreductase [Caldilineaceae bacterium]
MKAAYDVTIIGAGPAGSAAAAALAQRGWDVLLLEQHQFPQHKVCGEFLSPEAQHSLHNLHLDEWVAGHLPVALDHVQLHAPGGRQLRVPLPGRAWGISRYTLDAALAAAAQAYGATLWTGVTVTAVSPPATAAALPASGYRLTLRTKQNDGEPSRPSTIATRALLYACGRHNRLTSTGSSTAGNLSQIRRVGIKCHYEGNLAPPQVELYFFPGGYGGINPVENGCTNLCLLVTYEAFQRVGGSPLAMLHKAAEWHPTLAARLAGAQPVPTTLKTAAAIDTDRPATPWRGAPCLGDAAAMIAPLCGDGMAMALRSAELCVPLTDAYLRRHLAPAEWAECYTSAWHREFNRRLAVGRVLQTVLSAPRLAAILLRFGQWSPALATYLVGATRGVQPGCAPAGQPTT